jgi:hypothetical protein
LCGGRRSPVAIALAAGRPTIGIAAAGRKLSANQRSRATSRASPYVVPAILLWWLIGTPLDHSWITDSRHRPVPEGHVRTQRRRHSSSAGPWGSRGDSRGHVLATVRDREALGSNPGPPDQFCVNSKDPPPRVPKGDRRAVLCSSCVFVSSPSRILEDCCLRNPLLQATQLHRMMTA